MVVVEVGGVGVVVLSVVVVVLEGSGVVVCCVVVVEVGAVASFFSFTVVLQADSATRATAARHGKISFFISDIIFGLFFFVTNGNYAMGCSQAMGSNPTKDAKA